jgi:hypothetical protein
MITADQVQQLIDNAARAGFKLVRASDLPR